MAVLAVGVDDLLPRPPTGLSYVPDLLPEVFTTKEAERVADAHPIACVEAGWCRGAGHGGLTRPRATCGELRTINNVY